MISLQDHKITLPKNSPPLHWERVDCNLCRHDDTTTYHRERLPYFDTLLNFEIVCCRRCSLVYTNPRLKDYNAAYLKGFDETDSQIEDHARFKSVVFQNALSRIRNWQNTSGAPAGGKLLDIGCGSGHFIKAANQNSFDACGIEPTCGSAAYGIEKLNLNILNQDLFETQLPENHFDVITAWDVIEHLPDPQAMLRRAAKWLKPGGIMALRFPSAPWQKIKGFVFHQLFNSERASFAPTIHLYFFSEKTFTLLCDRIGLEVLRFHNTDCEPNTRNTLFDAAKRISQFTLQGIELCSGKRLGNLEVYCRKTPNV